MSVRPEYAPFRSITSAVAPGIRRAKVDAPWTIISQGLSSASNFLFNLGALRLSGLEDYGRLSLVFTILTTGLLATRITLATVLMLNPDPSRVELRNYFGAQLMLGMALAPVVALAAFAAGIPGVGCLLAIAQVVVLVQDASRMTAFAKNRPRTAALSDGTWLVVSLCALVLMSVSATVDLTRLVIAWLLGGLVSVIVIRQEWSLPSSTFLRRHRRDLRYLLGEATLVLCNGYILNLLVLAMVGFGGLGLLRAAQTVVSPLTTLSQAISVLSLRAFSAKPTPRETLVRALRLLLLYQTAVLALYLMLVLSRLGSMLLANSWALISGLLVVIFVGHGASGLTVIAQNLLRAGRGNKAVLTMRLWLAFLEPLVVVITLLSGEPRGAVIGLVASQCIASFVWVVAAHHGARSRGAPRAVGHESNTQTSVGCHGIG